MWSVLVDLIEFRWTLVKVLNSFGIRGLNCFSGYFEQLKSPQTITV